MRARSLFVSRLCTRDAYLALPPQMPEEGPRGSVHDMHSYTHTQYFFLGDLQFTSIAAVVLGF